VVLDGKGHKRLRKKEILTASLTLVLVAMFTSAPNSSYTDASEILDAKFVAAAASSPPVAEWNQTYGGAEDDFAYSIIQTSDGGYLAAGVTYSFGAVAGDAWLVKIDALGNTQWNKKYGGDQDDSAYAVQNTKDGGYIVAGTTYSFGAGNGDFWLLRLDSLGNMIWNRTYGGIEEDSAEAVCETLDGDYIFSGLTASWGAGGYDFLLLKIDSDGNVAWSKTYGGAGDDEARSISQTTEGGYILAGFTDSFGTGGDFWLVKTDSEGTKTWSKTYGGANNDYAWSVRQTVDEGYVVAGSTESFGAGLNDFWLVRTDWAGNLVWNRTFGGTRDDCAYSVIQTSEGGYLLAGSTSSYGAGLSDYWLVRTDSTGNVLWNKAYGKTTWDEAYSVQQTSDKGFIIVGNTFVSNVTLYDAWIIKLASTAGPDLTPPTTTDNYDGQWHASDFTVTLAANDALSGIAETYYRINDEPIKTVGANGQPFVVTEGANSILEYWSVDNAGNEELPHKFVGEIKLDKTLPIADAGPDQTVNEDTAVILNGSASYDKNGIISCNWTFTDVAPQLLNGKTTTYTFATPGSYAVMLKAFDPAGNYGIDSAEITVLDVTKPIANAGQDRTVRPNETVTFDASGSTDNVGVVSYEWDFGDGTTGIGRTTTHIYANETAYTVTLTVKDSAGNTATHSTVVTVRSPGPFEVLYPWIVGGVAVVIAALAGALFLRKRESASRP
jgi:hypothetical protein